MNANLFLSSLNSMAHCTLHAHTKLSLINQLCRYIVDGTQYSPLVQNVYPSVFPSIRWDMVRIYGHDVIALLYKQHHFECPIPEAVAASLPFRSAIVRPISPNKRTRAQIHKKQFFFVDSNYYQLSTFNRST